MVIESWNYRSKHWVYIMLSKFMLLNWLSFTSKFNDKMVNFQMNNDLLKEGKGWVVFDKYYQSGNDWEQIKVILGLMDSMKTKLIWDISKNFVGNIENYMNELILNMKILNWSYLSNIR